MNSVVHFEIPSEDKARAKKFYAKAFGWEFSDMEVGEGETYTGAITTETDDETYMPKKAGAINGAIFTRDEKLVNPVITIDVNSIEDAFEKIEAAGGQKLIEKGEVPEMGYYAYFKDSEGNVMGLWQTINN